MSPVRPNQPGAPAAPRGILCPYCGRISVNPKRCDGCGGFFDPLSRQATQNGMGPWYLRDPANPFRPGCSYETLREMVKRGRIRPDTIIRGPTTRQFWNFASRTPTVANLLGICHNCHAKVSPDDYSCAACGAVFTPDTDRQHLGLAPVHLLPGQAAPEIIAAASLDRPPEGTQRQGLRRVASGGGSRQPTHQAREAVAAGGSGVGRVALVLGILLLMGVAAVGAVVVSRVLDQPRAPDGTGGGAVAATGAPAPPAESPAPAPPAVPADSANAAPGPPDGQAEASPDAPAEPGESAAPADVPPTGELATTPEAAPSTAAFIEAIRSGTPPDNLEQQVRERLGNMPEAAAWIDLIRRREALGRARGLP